MDMAGHSMACPDRVNKCNSASRASHVEFASLDSLTEVISIVIEIVQH